ncbi:MAG TPA: PEP/pyruvate-binding domain-containing protein, partial [Candidatus Obscuribacterales bacterium]
MQLVPEGIDQRLAWGTKAETLASLEGRLQQAQVLPQLRFGCRDWPQVAPAILAEAAQRGWLELPLVVRSSALDEDGHLQSLAGHFTSVLNVLGPEALQAAILRVIGSFTGDSPHQVFLQPQLTDIRLSGVAFSREPNTGSPYVVINYDDASGTTDSVTSGRGQNLRTCYHHLQAGFEAAAPLDRIVRLLAELEQIFAAPALDIEFALDASDTLWLLQVRPLLIRPCSEAEAAQLQAALAGIVRRLGELDRPHPYLHGSGTVFGVMPDWNPAEIIGVRPGILARSLYQELVTDAIWAYQRHNYGYCNLRSFPLLQSFGGSP